MTETPEAFVLLPFETDFDELYDSKINPTLSEIGYNVSKADEPSPLTQRNILEDIVTGINQADLIVADLTNSNPNVFYELGIAHGLGVPTILITQDIGEVPFDLDGYRIIEYSENYREIEKLEEELKEIGKAHLQGDVKFSSPVKDYTDEELKVTTTISETDEDVEVEESETGKGVLDYAEDVEESQIQFLESINEISKLGIELENDLEELSTEINELAAQSQVSPRRLNQVIRKAGRRIQKFSGDVETEIESIEVHLETLMEGLESFLEFADSSNPEHRDELKNAKENLQELKDETQITADEFEEMEDQFADLRGINTELTRASNSLGRRVTTLHNIMKEANSKADRMIALIDQKLAEEAD